MANAKSNVISIATQDNRLRVDLVKRGDRFEQKIFLDNAEVACSVEGNVEQSWPASPPLQELSLESFEDRDVILGVGAAGRSHWSMSLISESDSQSLLVELACRCREESDFLGSTYQACPKVDFHPSPGSQIQRQDGPGDRSIVTIRPRSHEHGTVQWAFRITKATQAT